MGSEREMLSGQEWRETGAESGPPSCNVQGNGLRKNVSWEELFCCQLWLMVPLSEELKSHF